MERKRQRDSADDADEWIEETTREVKAIRLTEETSETITEFYGRIDNETGRWTKFTNSFGEVVYTYEEVNQDGGDDTREK